MLKAIFTLFSSSNGSRRIYQMIKKFDLNIRSVVWRNGFRYRLNDGRQFICYPGNKLSEEIYFAKQYETTESEILKILLGKGDIFLDIGANTGYFTTLASGLVGPEGKVFAFEPGKKTNRLLRSSINLLNTVNIENLSCAIGSTDGVASFVNSAEGGDAQQGFKQVRGLVGGTTVADVKVVSLDTFLSNIPIIQKEMVKVVKCDVEGAECEVLAGASEVLKGKSRPFWLIESNRPALEGYGKTPADMISYFSNCTFFYIELVWPPSMRSPPGRRFERSAVETLPDECNIFVIPNELFTDPAVENLIAAGILRNY